MKTKREIDPKLAAAISYLGFLLFWQLIVLVTPVGQIVPGPFHVLAAFFKSFVVPIGPNTIQVHTLWSLSRVLTGFIFGSITGIVLGIAMGLNKYVKAIFYPIYQLIRPIPPIAWIPLIILWFGLGEMAKYALIFLATFANITTNAYEGAKNTDPLIIGAAKMLGANPIQIFFTVILPASVPYIFSGLHVALSVSWRTAVAAEMIRALQGVGWVIINAQAIYNVTQMLIGIIAIAITGILLTSIMRLLEKRLWAWKG